MRAMPLCKYARSNKVARIGVIVVCYASISRFYNANIQRGAKSSIAISPYALIV